MDKANPTAKRALPGISIRNGPIEEMDIDGPVGNELAVNGTATGKRKARQSLGNGKSKNYKEVSSDEGGNEPLVCFILHKDQARGVALLTLDRASGVVHPAAKVKQPLGQTLMIHHWCQRSRRPSLRPL